MTEEEYMFDILDTVEKQDEMKLSLNHDDPIMPIVKKMIKLGYLENFTVMFAGRIIQPTAAGLRALAQARTSGAKGINWVSESRPIHFQQTVNGTATTQVGDHNNMTVYVAVAPSEKFFQELKEIRELIEGLPEDDREDARTTLDLAEKAAKKGLMDRVQTYGPTLLSLTTGSVELAKKIKETFGL